MKFFYIYLFIYLAVPGLTCGMRELSCPNRDWTQVHLHWEHGVLAPGPPGKFLHFPILCCRYRSLSTSGLWMPQESMKMFELQNIGGKPCKIRLSKCLIKTSIQEWGSIALGHYCVRNSWFTSCYICHLSNHNLSLCWQHCYEAWGKSSMLRSYHIVSA